MDLYDERDLPREPTAKELAIVKYHLLIWLLHCTDIDEARAIEIVTEAMSNFRKTTSWDKIVYIGNHRERCQWLIRKNQRHFSIIIREQYPPSYHPGYVESLPMLDETN